jgi:hypothetical protein
MIMMIIIMIIIIMIINVDGKYNPITSHEGPEGE